MLGGDKRIRATVVKVAANFGVVYVKKHGGLEGTLLPSDGGPMSIDSESPASFREKRWQLRCVERRHRDLGRLTKNIGDLFWRTQSSIQKNGIKGEYLGYQLRVHKFEGSITGGLLVETFSCLNAPLIHPRNASECSR